MVRHKHARFLTTVVGSIDHLTPFEKAVTIIGSFEPISQIPQVVLVYSLKSAEELSLFSWSFGVFATVLWLLYAIKKRSTPLIISSVLWLAADIPIVVAILIFN